MSKQSKIILFTAVLCLHSTMGVSQDLWVKSLEGFTQLAESVEKLFGTFDRADNDINKERAIKMANALHKQVADLGLAKKEVRIKLDEGDNNVDMKREIDMLMTRTDDIKKTLEAYDDLISAAGISAQELSFSLRTDFLQKASSLREAKRLFNRNISDEDAKKELKVHFDKCIVILDSTRQTLKRFIASASADK